MADDQVMYISSNLFEDLREGSCVHLDELLRPVSSFGDILLGANHLQLVQIHAKLL